MLLLKKWHKSKTDYLILDRKKWDFQIRIILIQIKCFEQLAHNDPCHRSTNHQHLSIITQFSLYLALNKDMDPTHVNPNANKKLVYSLLFLTLLPSVYSAAILIYSIFQCQSTEVCASSSSSVSSPSAICKKKDIHCHHPQTISLIYNSSALHAPAVCHKVLIWIHLPPCLVYVSWQKARLLLI